MPRLPAELIRIIATISHPDTARNLKNSNKLLHHLITHNDLGLIDMKWFFSKTSPYPSRNYPRDALWTWSAKRGYENVVVRLLKMNVRRLKDVAERVEEVKSRQTALKIAAENGFAGIVRMLLPVQMASYAHVDDPNPKPVPFPVPGPPALLFRRVPRAPPGASIRFGGLRRFGWLGSNKDHFRRDTIHIAAAFGEVDVVAALLNDGVDVNDLSGEYGTPLHCAVAGDVLGYQWFKVKKSSESFREDRLLGLKQLRDKDRCMEVVRLLLKHGAYVNTDGAMITPLHIAVEGNMELVKCLIEAGADVNLHDSTRRRLTPLHVAVQYAGTALQVDPERRLGGTAIIDYLLANGANVKAKTEEWGDQTALHLAASYLDCEVVEMLVEAGADVTVVDSLGCTPLQTAERQFAIRMEVPDLIMYRLQYVL